MPKTVSCNAFYLFMVETKKRLESRGEHFPRGLEDVKEVASDMWVRMSPDQKATYKERAKHYKKSDEFATHKQKVRMRQASRAFADFGNRQRARKAAAVGEDDVEEMLPHVYPSDDEDRHESFKFKKEKDRKEMMDYWKWNMCNRPDAIRDMKFYMISFVAHGHTKAYVYFPAEVAIVEFTIRQGITTTYSKIIGPHSLPATLIPAARENYELHKIPFYETIPEMTDFSRVLDEILRICRPSYHSGRLFCLSKEYNCVQGSVSYLQGRAKMMEIRPEQITCVDDLYILLCEWKEKCSAPAEIRPFNECDGLTDIGLWYRHPDFPCDYHKSQNVHRCALATAKRATYYLLQRLNAHYDIEMTTNHRPPPMPVENEEADGQASAAAMWARATQQAQHLFIMDDDATTTVTSVTHRTMPIPPRSVVEDDIEMPKTLPLALRRFAGHVMPDTWGMGPIHPPYRKATCRQMMEKGEDDEDTGSMGAASSVLTGATAFGYVAPPDNIVWGQNKDIRNLIYSTYIKDQAKEEAEQNGASSSGIQRSNQTGNITGQDQFSNSAMASNVAYGNGDTRAQFPFSPSSNQNRDAVGNNQLWSDMDALNLGPPPFVFPTPLSTITRAPTTFRHILSGPGPRTWMAPRVSLPSPSSSISGTATPTPTFAPRPPMMRGMPDGKSTSSESAGRLTPVMAAAAGTSQIAGAQSGSRGLSPTSVASGNSAAPVKTQSLVKQMLAERMRQRQHQQCEFEQKLESELQ